VQVDGPLSGWVCFGLVWSGLFVHSFSYTCNNGAMFYRIAGLSNRHQTARCTYTNKFPIAIEDFKVDKQRTIAQEAIGIYGGGISLAGRLSGIRTQNGKV